MGDEPDKSEASTAGGGTEGGDASKAESGAAGDADAGGAQTKIVLAAVVGIVVTIIIIIVLLLPHGSAAATTVAAAPAGGNNTNTTAGTKSSAAPPGGPTPSTLGPSKTGTADKIPDDFVACITEVCPDIGKMTGCTEIIAMFKGQDMATFKAKKPPTGKRHYIGFDYATLKTTASADATKLLSGSETSGYAVLHTDVDDTDLETTAKKIVVADKLLIVGLTFKKGIDASADKIKKLGAHLIILETHMTKATGDAELAPPVWVEKPASVTDGLTFDDVKKTLEAIKGTALLSISASVAVFEYSSADTVSEADLFSKKLTPGSGGPTFSDQYCEASILDALTNVAVVADKDAKNLQVYENDKTLKAKMDKVKDKDMNPGWTLFGAECEDSPSSTSCPLRYADPASVIKTADVWQPSTGGNIPPSPKAAPDVSLFCVISPDSGCATTNLPPATLYDSCDGVIYYDPAWPMSATPTDELYKTIVAIPPDDKHYIGVKYSNYKAPGLPTDFKGIAFMDTDSATVTPDDANTQLNAPEVSKLNQVLGIKYVDTITEDYIDKLITSAFIILQTVTEIPKPACAVTPTTLWTDDLLAKHSALLQKRPQSSALSVTLEGILYTLSAAPAGTDAAAKANEVINKATPPACSTDAPADMTKECKDPADDTNKESSVWVDGTAATVYESVETLKNKKAKVAGAYWAVFWAACKARDASCKTSEELITALK